MLLTKHIAGCFHFNGAAKRSGWSTTFSAAFCADHGFCERP
jgi:hypothetical protein